MSLWPFFWERAMLSFLEERAPLSVLQLYIAFANWFASSKSYD